MVDRQARDVPGPSHEKGTRRTWSRGPGYPTMCWWRASARRVRAYFNPETFSVRTPRAQRREGTDGACSGCAGLPPAAHPAARACIAGAEEASPAGAARPSIVGMREAPLYWSGALRPEVPGGQPPPPLRFAGWRTPAEVRRAQIRSAVGQPAHRSRRGCGRSGRRSRRHRLGSAPYRRLRSRRAHPWT